MRRGVETKNRKALDYEIEKLIGIGNREPKEKAEIQTTFKNIIQLSFRNSRWAG